MLILLGTVCVVSGVIRHRVVFRFDSLGSFSFYIAISVVSLLIFPEMGFMCKCGCGSSVVNNFRFPRRDLKTFYYKNIFVAPMKGTTE